MGSSLHQWSGADVVSGRRRRETGQAGAGLGDAGRVGFDTLVSGADPLAFPETRCGWIRAELGSPEIECWVQSITTGMLDFQP